MKTEEIATGTGNGDECGNAFDGDHPFLHAHHHSVGAPRCGAHEEYVMLSEAQASDQDAPGGVEAPRAQRNNVHVRRASTSFVPLLRDSLRSA